MSFVGEGAIDEGGPKREFFCLLIQEIGQSEYMQGGTQKFFLANVPAILVCIYICILTTFAITHIHRGEISNLLDIMQGCPVYRGTRVSPTHRFNVSLHEYRRSSICTN